MEKLEAFLILLIKPLSFKVRVGEVFDDIQIL